MTNKLQSSISLKTNNSFLTDSTYLEEVDEKKLFALTRSENVLKSTTTWWEDISIDWAAIYKNQIPTELNFCKNLLEKLVKIGDKYYLRTQYIGARGENRGRVYPKYSQSLGQMRRPVRHFLCKDLYYDLDIVNAHLSILLSVCISFGITCKYVKDYCKNRDKWLEKIQKKTQLSRSDSKKLIIALINGSDINNYLRKNNAKKVKGKYHIPKCVFDFKNEIVNITNALITEKGTNFYE